MKQVLLICSIALCAVVVSGCQSAYHVGDGFPRTMPGVLYADQTSGGYIAPKMESMKDIEVLGPVYSTVDGSNVLMLISAGDISIAKAKEIALRKYPDADDVVNVEVDLQQKSILSLFNIVTLHYRGIAIKYKK